MKCTKAIIPVAGFGTRRLPITKSIEKSMLPILNRPMIDYVVEDCIKAGITDIYIVVSPGATQIRSYYSPKPELETYLQDHGKDALLPLITPPDDVRFHFIEQGPDANGRFGTAVPVWLCREFVEADEHVLVLMGDDVIYNADGSSEVRRLVDHLEQTGARGALLGVEISPEEVSHYGVLVTEQQEGYQRFLSVQEKPSVEEAKSNLINISKYILQADFFGYLDSYMKTEQPGEYYITDALNTYVAAGNALAVLPARGEYLDSGTVEHWLKANQTVARHLHSA